MKKHEINKTTNRNEIQKEIIYLSQADLIVGTAPVLIAST